MRKYAKITPEGTRDLLFGECAVRRDIETKLASLFRGMGYQEVETPGLEFYDVFQPGAAGLPTEMMFKLSDSKGRLLVLRPDSTMPIARMTATRLQNAALPIRLYYNQKIFHSNPSFSGHSDEMEQMGVELIGAKGLRADLEMITTSVRALSYCVKDFRIELGHAGFFQDISARLPVGDEQREDLRLFIESKNFAALDNLLDTLEDGPAVRLMRKLPRLFGGEEVFDEAEALCGEEIPTGSLDYLKSLYSALIGAGLGDKIIIDLGLVHRNEYYTDIIFRGYTDGSSDTILSGGRYDHLLSHYGTPMPAIGFAVDVDAVAKLSLSDPRASSPKSAQVLVHGRDGFELQAIRYAEQLREQGLVCELSVFDTEEAARQYAQRRGISRMDVVYEKIEISHLEPALV